MTGTHFEQEKQKQFERDKSAFQELNTVEQRVAERIADVTFRGRRGIVYGGRAVLIGVEYGYNFLIRGPYLLVASGVTFAAKWAAQHLEQANKWAIHQIAQLRLDFSKNRDVEAWRKAVLAWEKEAIAKVDRFWRDMEKFMRGLGAGIIAGVGVCMLGLYRGTKWVLDPRKKNGEPLLGNERLNKWAGVVLAAGLFAGLGAGLMAIMGAAKVYALGKTAAIVGSGVSKSAQTWALVKLHGSVYAGIKVLELTMLPIIAATRQVLKSSKFCQGIAYRYNDKIREDLRIAPRRKLKFNFVEKSLEHMLNLGAPEHYEAQIRRAAAPVAPVAVPDVSPFKDGHVQGGFNKSAQSVVLDAAPAPSRYQKPEL